MISHSRIILAFACLWFIPMKSFGQDDLRFAPSSSPMTPGAVTFIYDPSDGNFSFDTSYELTRAIEVRSQDRLWTGEAPDVLDGLFDIWSPEKLFKFKLQGFDDVDFGAVLPKGLSRDFLINDFLVDGNFIDTLRFIQAPGGGPYLFVVPEPESSCWWIGIMSCFLVRSRPRSEIYIIETATLNSDITDNLFRIAAEKGTTGFRGRTRNEEPDYYRATEKIEDVISFVNDNNVF